MQMARMARGDDSDKCLRIVDSNRVRLLLELLAPTLARCFDADKSSFRLGFA